MNNNYMTPSKNILEAARELADKLKIPYDNYTSLPELKSAIINHTKNTITNNFDQFKATANDWKIKQAKRIKKVIVTHNNPQETGSNYIVFTVLIDSHPISSIVYLKKSGPQFIQSAVVDLLKNKQFVYLPSTEEQDDVDGVQLKEDLTNKNNFRNEFTVSELPLTNDDIKYLSNLR